MRLGQPQFPGQAGVLDAAQRRRAGAAAVTAQVDHVGEAFGHARRNRAHTHLGDKFDADAGVGVDGLQVVDQLRQVFDGVDVMVRRWADQRHARRAVAQHRNLAADFVAGQLTTFARLRSLCHLDLQLVGGHQVFGRHTEAARRHLFHTAGALGEVAVFGLAAFAAVAHAAQPVHGDGQHLVCFLAQRAVAHGCGAEAAHDAIRRFHLLHGDGRT